MNVILAVVITCSLMLTVQHSMLAQVKPKQKSQGKMQKTKEMNARIKGQSERKIKAKGAIKSEKAKISGVERYNAIAQNNLFMPLGTGGEVKREGFVLAGILGSSAFIQMEGSGKSFYVVEGESFGNDAKLVEVGADSVTILHEGSKKELRLTSGAAIGQGGGAKGGGSKQRQGSSGKNSKQMKTANRAGKKNWDGGEKKGGDTDWARNMSRDELSEVREDIGRYIEGLERKGVTDPKEYEGAIEKMETVERAIAERGDSK
jgi:hypothetical protein